MQALTRGEPLAPLSRKDKVSRPTATTTLAVDRLLPLCCFYLLCSAPRLLLLLLLCPASSRRGFTRVSVARPVRHKLPAYIPVYSHPRTGCISLSSRHYHPTAVLPSYRFASPNRRRGCGPCSKPFAGHSFRTIIEASAAGSVRVRGVHPPY